MRGPVVTVSGPHGTGKSTYAKALAESLRLRYVCAGALFRQLAEEHRMSLEQFSIFASNNSEIDHMIDEKTRLEAKSGSVVIDAQLAAWIVKELADVKLLLIAPKEVRYKRIAERDGKPLSRAKEETETRERIQKERYRTFYNIDVDDLSIYDIKIDTSLKSVDETKMQIIETVRNFLEKNYSSPP